MPYLAFLYIGENFLPTCLSRGSVRSTLEERDGCKLLSSELQRDVSGDNRWQRSLERPRSLCSDRDTGRRWEKKKTPKINVNNKTKI